MAYWQCAEEQDPEKASRLAGSITLADVRAVITSFDDDAWDPLAAAALEEEGIGYIDDAGNCLIYWKMLSTTEQKEVKCIVDEISNSSHAQSAGPQSSTVHLCLTLRRRQKVSRAAH